MNEQVSVVNNLPNEAKIGIGIIFLCMFLMVLLIRASIKRRKIIKAKKQELKDAGVVNMGVFTHINGLNLAENTVCNVLSYSDRYEFKSGALQFNLLKSKVIDVIIKTDTDIQKQYVSSIGGAVGGAVLFGPLGAMIGGRAKQKKSKTVSNYLIITYKDNNDEIKYIGFDVTKDYFAAYKFVKEFKAQGNAVTKIDL